MSTEKTFHEDWVAALNAMPQVGKDQEATIETKKGGSYSYKYATLTHVIEAVREVLAEHRLAFGQDVRTVDGMVEVTTTFFHASGETVDFGPLAFESSADPKAVGSAITYARRYQLTAALGIAPDEDDDGTRAAERAQFSSYEPETQRPSDWLAMRVAMFTQWDDETRKLKYKEAMEALGFERFQTQDHAEAVFDWMQEQYYEEHPLDDSQAPF